jgi:hypothetical protein
MSDKMVHFSQDLNVVMTGVREALHRWGLTEWREYLVVRVPGKVNSFIVLAHPSDKSDFADQLVRLHKDDASGDYRLVEIPGMDGELLREFTAAMRAADESFETEGGGTRHYLRDCLWPEMQRRGLAVVPSRLATAEGWQGGARTCSICHNPTTKHDPNCTGDVWTEYMELTAKLRDKHGIGFRVQT